MSVRELQVTHLGHFVLFDEWLLEIDSKTAWFVRLYHQNSPRRGFSVGDYGVEVFTAPDTCQPLRPMTPIEQALFELALKHCLRSS